MHSTYPMEWLLHLTGGILSVAAMILALKLVPLTGRAKAWLLLSAALITRVTSRVLELLSGNDGALLTDETYQVVSDTLYVVTSACLLGSIIFIRTIFLERMEARHKLEQRLDELRRFHEVAIGRELRMKELYDENQALKARRGEAGK